MTTPTLGTQSANPFVRSYQWLSEGANALTLFGSSGIGSIVAWLLPYDWKTAVPWMLTLCAFSGGWVAIQTLVWTWNELRRHSNQSRLELTADSGETGCVGIVHHGEPTTISATGRMIELLNGAPNPSPHRFECLLSKGSSREVARLLGDGDWATIVLASEWTVNETPYPEGEEHAGLRIHRGATVHCIPDAGALIEIEFKASPSFHGGAKTFTRSYKASWVEGRARIEDAR